jgi:phosphatidate cytidylyltransferase
VNLIVLLSLTFATLIAATLAGQILRVMVRSDGARAIVANANVRIGAWWVLCATVGLALTLSSWAVMLVFAVLSSLAVMEFAALSDDRPPRAALCSLTAMQYGLVLSGSLELFSIFVPLTALVFFPLRAALRGETAGYMERTSGLAWGLLACAYGVSHAPALLILNISGYEGRNTTLLFYFLLVVQLSDVFQYCWGKLAGRRRVAPRISPNKTWEGLIGGILSATAVGTALYRATPFQPWEAACISAAVTLAGFTGGLVMSAFKRERGVKDFGALVAGHGGVLDRLDSICFSAPVFFYLVRYFYR